MKIEIPQGVCVQAGVIAPDQPYEDRIVYRRRRLNRILFGLEDCCFYSRDSFGRTHHDWEEFPQSDVSGLKKRLQSLKRKGGLRRKGIKG